MRSTPSRVGSGIAEPSRKPPNVARFQHHEEAQLRAEEERERTLARPCDHPEGLVGEEERRNGALPPGQRELAAERQPVEHVPHVEEQRREHDLEPGGACGEQADGAQLGAAREDEDRERLRLDQREPGGARRDGIGEAEGNDPEPERRQDPEAPGERCPVDAQPVECQKP